MAAPDRRLDGSIRLQSSDEPMEAHAGDGDNAQFHAYPVNPHTYRRAPYLPHRWDAHHSRRSPHREGQPMASTQPDHPSTMSGHRLALIIALNRKAADVIPRGPMRSAALAARISKASRRGDEVSRTLQPLPPGDPHRGSRTDAQDHRRGDRLAGRLRQRVPARRSTTGAETVGPRRWPKGWPVNGPVPVPDLREDSPACRRAPGRPLAPLARTTTIPRSWTPSIRRSRCWARRRSVDWPGVPLTGFEPVTSSV